MPNDRAVQPDSHLLSVTADDTGTERVFLLSAAPIWIIISAWVRFAFQRGSGEALLLLHTSSKWDYIRRCRVAEGVFMPSLHVPCYHLVIFVLQSEVCTQHVLRMSGRHVLQTSPLKLPFPLDNKRGCWWLNMSWHERRVSSRKSISTSFIHVQKNVNERKQIWKQTKATHNHLWTLAKLW